MTKRILPTGKQKSYFFIHAVVFAIVTTITWIVYDNGVEGWAYPWPAWTTAAWGLALIGHWCALFTTYEDKANDEYLRQINNG